MPRIKKPKVFPEILEQVKARTSSNFKCCDAAAKGADLLRIGDRIKVNSGWDNLDSCFKSAVIIGFRQLVEDPYIVHTIIYNPNSNFEGVTGVKGVGIIDLEEIERI